MSKLEVFKWENGGSVDTEIYEIDWKDVLISETINYSKNQIVNVITLINGEKYVQPFKSIHYKIQGESKENFARYDNGSIVNVAQIKVLDENRRIAYLDEEKKHGIGIVNTRFQNIKKIFRELFG